MKPNTHIRRRGFTILELTIAMMVGMMTGSMVLALFNQQIAFLKIYRTQDFFTEEAPYISTYVSKLVGKADRFRLHDSLDDAIAGRNPRLTASPVALLNYRQPDGTMLATILSFEDLGTGPALNYYVLPVAGDPQWSVTTKAADVEFSMEQGVLRMTLTGPLNEQITYSGSMQQ